MQKKDVFWLVFLKNKLRRYRLAGLLSVCMLCLSTIEAAAQQRITMNLGETTLRAFFQELQKESGRAVLYNDDRLDLDRKVTVNERDVTMEELLTKVLKGSGMTYQLLGNEILILPAPPEKEEPRHTTVKGRVVDETGQPVPGATIVLKGSTLGTSADSEGRFTLSVPQGKEIVLRISFVGMRTEEAVYRQSAEGEEWRVVMRAEDTELNEVTVVSTGYQDVNRRDMVGTYAALKADDIRIAGASNISEMLQGQVAGMIVTRTSPRAGASSKIKIRGTTTLGNTDPLFVVDGIIQDEPIQFNVGVGMVDDMEEIIGNQVSWLNPGDIETITVLKDASATAIYGSRASNGVIVVTTKRPKVGDRISINYTGSVSVTPRLRYSQFNVMDSRERVAFSEEAFAAGAKYASVPLRDNNTFEGVMRQFFDGDITEEQYAARKAYLETVNTDWLKLLTRAAVSHSHNVSVGGASEKATYLFSLGYNKDNGQEKGNSSERFTSRAAMNLRIGNNIRLAFNINGTVGKNVGFANGVSPLNYATSTSRAIPAYEEDGSYAYYQRANGYKYNRENVSLSYNILNEMENNESVVKNGRVSVGLDFTWTITDWLRYQLTGGYSYNSIASERSATERSWYIANKYRGYDYGTVEANNDWYWAAQLPYGGELFTSNATQHSYNIQNKLLIQKQFNDDHRLNVMLGTEARATKDKNTQMTMWGYAPDRGYKFIKPNVPENIRPVGATTSPEGFDILNALYDSGQASIVKQKNNFFSLFATVAYSLKDRYVLNFNMRNDASNRFGQDANNHFDPIYSFGLSWRMSEESWMAGAANVISDLNVKATYGIQGNADLTKTPELVLQTQGIKDLYNTYYSTIVSIPNPDLSWERTHSWDFGLELRLFRAMNVVADYYTRRSNAVISQDIPYENGMETMSINGGRLYNRGFEGTVSFNPVVTKDFGLNISVNASKNWNEGGATPFEATYTDFLNGVSTSVLKEGYPVSGFWSYSFAGLSPTDGRPLFNNLDTETETALADPTTVLVYSGSKEPDFTGGMNLSVRYKNLTLNSSFALLLGGHQRLSSPYKDFSQGKRIPEPYVNLTRRLNDRWKKPGDETRTTIPALVKEENSIQLPFQQLDNWMNVYAYSDALVVSSSFLRCRNLALNWRMGAGTLKKLGLTNLSATFSVSNLFVVASNRFDGFDPELDESVMPKSFSLSLNIGL